MISHCNFKIIWENPGFFFFSCRKFEGKLMFPSLCGTFLWPPEVKAAGKRPRALWEEGVATGECQYSAR